VIFPPELARPGSEEQALVQRLDPARLPRHVAIIMDGNGRWARAHGQTRVAGHRAGVDAVRDTVEAAARLGLQVLTIYAFSTENWKRPRIEVQALMGLLKEYLRRELRTLTDNDIRLCVIGRIDDLPRAVRRELVRALDRTADNRGLVLNVALSYGGRAEIVEACRAIVRQGVPAESVDEQLFERHLQTAGLPDPDLLIRTSGEMRISNFLPWQLAYSELWFTDVLWPDFRRRHLFEALLDYQSRERRFGGLTPEAPMDPAAAARG